MSQKSTSSPAEHAAAAAEALIPEALTRLGEYVAIPAVSSEPERAAEVRRMAEVAAADFVKPSAVVDFKEAWQTIGADCEVVETFSLSYGSIKAAMDAVIEFVGMAPCENSANPAEGARTHTVMLAGLFLGGVQVFAIVNLRVDSPKAVGMRLSVRSGDDTISQFVASSVA